jgi:hypothetical protein
VRYFQTNNYWRFTWKRQLHGTLLARSENIGLYYFRYQGEWRRSAHMRRTADAARKQKCFLEIRDGQTFVNPEK